MEVFFFCEQGQYPVVNKMYLPYNNKVTVPLPTRCLVPCQREKVLLSTRCSYFFLIKRCSSVKKMKVPSSTSTSWICFHDRKWTLHCHQNIHSIVNNICFCVNKMKVHLSTSCMFHEERSFVIKMCVLYQHDRCSNVNRINAFLWTRWMLIC